MHDHLGALVIGLVVLAMCLSAVLRMGRTLATHRARQPVLTPLADVPWDQLRDEVYDHDAAEAAKNLDVEWWLEHCGWGQS